VKNLLLVARLWSARICRTAVLLVAFLGAVVASDSHAAEPRLKLEKGDRIAIIGNTLADRMQHDAWLETYIHALFPEHDLTFRNLGYPGDELKIRLREENFGDPDQWLTKVQADVVFCFFGYNEALRGDAGLATFRTDLAETIDGMLSQTYNGKTAPRLVMFSPIAHEDLHSPHLPDGAANNRNLANYTAAMREVCQAKSVPFVNLFHPTQRLYSEAEQPLTINGIHLSEDGGRALAGVITGELFGEGKPALDEPLLVKLREAIQERNYYWFSRYRVIDGYNVFGGRSKLAWFGQSNADVMMREMEIFDVMTANRDRRVWAAARGSDLIAKDDNLPPELEVRTNKPGDQEDGSFSYLGGEEAISKMTLAEGMQVNLFASEEMFPELVNPVQMAVDPDGHLYVSVWPSYPHWNPTQPRTDRILCLRDDDGDGVADRCVIFADELNSVTGFEFWGGGMIVAALPELWFLKDTDGDGKADLKIRMLQGLSSADSHHSANAMLLGPDGWLYWSRGIFNVAAIETPTRTYRSGQSGVHRFNPRTFEMEFHFPIGPNPHGDVFDQWGYQFANDGTTGTGSYINIGKGIGNKHWFEKRVRPVSATGILSSSHFPEANQGNFLICNTIGVLGVLQHEVKYSGAEITAVEVEPILLSDDPNFRPSDVEIGGDGALYVADWCNAIIGHMQHNMRDPNRDNQHGRIYRVTYKDRPLVQPLRLKDQPIASVCDAFYAQENSARYRARIELSGRATADVIEQVLEWADERDVTSAEDAQALLECLWVFEEHRVPQPGLVATVLRAEEPRVRAAAVRTLGHWAGQVPQWRPLLLRAAQDESPLVRAEAVKAAAEFSGMDAAEVLFQVMSQPVDPELETVLKYASDRLGVAELVQAAIGAGHALSPPALTYALQHARPEDLAKLPPSAAIYEAILSRSDVPVAVLGQSLSGLAELNRVNPLDLALTLLEQRDANLQADSLAGLGQWLLEQPVNDFKLQRGRIEHLALTGNEPRTRRLAFGLLIQADGSGGAAFYAASNQPESQRDLLAAIATLGDKSLRAGLYPELRNLIFDNVSTSETSGAALLEQTPGIYVEFYHPNPPNVAVETLDKLTPNATGVAQQIVMDVPQRTEDDAFALRFTGMISVPRTGQYTFATKSDDGSRLYINDRLIVDNDGLHGMLERTGTIDLTAGLHKIVVTYFDNGGGDGLEVTWSGPRLRKQAIGPDRLFLISGEESLRDTAIRTLAMLPGRYQEKWNDLTTLIKGGHSRPAAISVLKTIPPEQRPAEGAGDLVDNLIGYLSELPLQMRTGQAAMETIELVRSLAERLPAQRAAAIQARLENLDVRVIAIGTVQERMIYDKELIVVQASKPVEFRFSNTDFMPHNFVIVQPGALEEIGELAEATARDADAKDRHYVPKSPKVMLASRMLESGQSEALLFEAPNQPGIYPYVCTYPGHWRRMFGALYVVEDYDQYQANPEAYLAEHPLELHDELLKFTARNTDWQYDELISKLSPLPQGRSFEVGRNLFRAANCVGCHKLGGEGHDLGPDLTTMDASRHTIEHILRSTVEPSAQIDEKYQSFNFLLDSGKVVTGTILEETPAELKVLVDPLARRDPITIDRNEIEEQVKSPVSIMPAGLLSNLTEEEIIDLVAYIYARGDEKHRLYHAGHQHHAH